VHAAEWCKEIGVEPLWNFLLGFPGESPDDYPADADLTARVCHLPRRSASPAIRLDRSAQLRESDRLGLHEVRPLPFYEFI